MKVLSSMSLALFVAAALVAPMANALDVATQHAERERIKAEREQVEAAYVARENQCRQRFVVTPCMEQARRDRRQAMDRLRQQQRVLDEAQRKERAAQRIEEIGAKASANDAEQRQSAARERQETGGRAEAAASASMPRLPKVPGAASMASPALNRTKSSADEAKHRADYELRRKEARDHKDAVIRRNAERAASGKAPAKGLPTVPAAASAAQ